MLFADTLVIIRGGGDLATGVAYRLHKAGFPYWCWSWHSR